MPRPYYPNTDPREEPGVWVVVHSTPRLIVEVPVEVALTGPDGITAYLREHGLAVQSPQDWHESPRVPDEP